MKLQQIGGSSLEGTRIALGCMRMNVLSNDEAKNVIQNSLDLGINYFDHADIYGKGESEKVFAKAIADLGISRNQYVLQSKCGIKPNAYDFTKAHIIESVEGSLSRLATDHLDVLLLHRPDTLMDPAEIAEAFNELEKSGKVLHFGVSNFNPGQVELLQKTVKQPLLINQLQFGLMHTGMIDADIHVNMTDNGSVDHDGGLLAYSRLHNMTIQAWSPFQFGFFEGVYIDNPKFPELNKKLQELADKYVTSKNAIATAWILRHPAKIQMIAGTMNPTRLAEIAAGDDVDLTHQEWYDLYLAAGNKLP